VTFVRQNVLGLIAIFIALCGTAVDALGGADVDESALSAQDCSTGYVTNLVEVGSAPGSSFGPAGITGSYECNGQRTQVRRNAPGSYCVQFAGMDTVNYQDDFPVMASVNGGADFIRAAPGSGAVCPSDSYEVAAFDHAGTPADATFTLITL
jgi:hypothetical protein